MNEKTTFYPTVPEIPQSYLIYFHQRLREFSLELQEKKSDFNLEDFYDFLWLSWAKPDMEPYRNLIALTYNKVFDVRSRKCPLQELLSLIPDIENIFKQLVLAEKEKEKKKNSFYISNHRQAICKPLRDSIASLILENEASEVKEHFQDIPFQEQQKILQNISYSSKSSQALFLQFCSEIFSNMDLITELLYKKHYSENSGE